MSCSKFNLDFTFSEALKVTTDLAEIIDSLPVLGFLPILLFLSLILNVPSLAIFKILSFLRELERVF